MGSLNLEGRMKATILILAALAFTASAMFTPTKQHQMPQALRVLASLPKLMKKDIKNNPITDCTKCYSDILLAIEDCSIDDTASTHEILECVETVLVTSSDCIVGFNQILDGELDDIPENAFYMVGDIDEVLQKAEAQAVYAKSFTPKNDDHPPSLS